MEDNYFWFFFVFLFSINIQNSIIYLMKIQLFKTVIDSKQNEIGDKSWTREKEKYYNGMQTAL